MKLVDINVTGNLNRKNNVISGFSTSNYGTLYAPFSPKGQDFEIGIKFKTSPTYTSSSGNKFLFHCPTATSSRGFTIHIHDGVVSTNSSNSDDSGWTSTAVGTYTSLEANTTYWIKAKRENNTLYLYYSLNGKDYILGQSGILDYNYPDFIGSYLGVRWNPNSSIAYESLNDIASIDLSECYIDIADERLWTGCRDFNTNYYTYDTTLNNITITGSPTVSNGEISGFSTSKYATTTVNIPTGGINTFEVGCKFTIGSTFNDYMRIIEATSNNTTYQGFCIQVDNKSSSPNVINLLFRVNDNYFAYNVKEDIQINTTYWCKWIYDGNYVKSYYSYDGINYTLNDTTASSSDLTTALSYFLTTTYTLGVNSQHQSGQVFTGSIDLKQTYIKINDETVWTGTYPQVDTVSTYYNYLKINERKYKTITPLKSNKIYYKYISWSQPASMSSNGTLGGDSFAVAAQYEYQTHSAYHGLDATGWLGTQGISYFIFYNPVPLRVTDLTFSQISSNYIQIYNLYVSNNGSSWTLIGNYTQGSGTHSNTIIGTEKGYKYYKIEPTSIYTRSAFCNLIITAQEVTESDSSDYDYYINLPTINKAFVETVRHYYKYVGSDEPWSQPASMSADGTMGGNSFAVAASGFLNGAATKFPAYKAFETYVSSDANNGWIGNNTTSYFIFYNPEKIKVSNISFNQAHLRSDIYYMNTYDLYASNDNSSWTLIGSYTQGSGTHSNVINNVDYYNYYKIQATSSSNAAGISELVITAVTGSQTIIESDETDYDFYEDIDVYKIIKDTNETTGKNTYKAFNV